MPFPARIDPETLGADALAIVEELGWDAWSLREIAKGLGVSPNALYRHVSDRDSLLVSVGVAAVHELRAALNKSRAKGRDRILDLARRYVRFAIRRPHAFAAFVHAKPEPDDPRAQAWFLLWTEVLEEIRALLPESSAAAAFAFWSLIHGRAELARGPARSAEPTAGLDVAVDALLRGFESLGEVPSPLPDYVPR
ncbi:TetR/AcrR family transcriptional regulator [Luteimonas salinilitoris]|uniref:TetR/AcrR family transcriptional regulator n=1 Tax=Luteimonas salinilitoris TaxID=3237697 RepID=A0ABV4HYC8_9GAMM